MDRSRRRWTGCCAVVWLALTAGCYKATFYRDPQMTSGVAHEEWTDFFLFGLVGNEVVDVEKYCPANSVAMVRTGANLGTGLVGVVTLGIYTPHKVYVTCAAATQAHGADEATLLARSSRKEKHQ
jgi:hypothetical protein